MLTAPQAPAKTHKVRTFFASIAGIIAVYLILASITVVWLNRTLTDTATYVRTVAPLVTKPAIQNFVSQKVAEQLLDDAPVQDMAALLLPANGPAGVQTADQLRASLKPAVEKNVLQIVQSPGFAALWTDTNRTAHASLVSQLDSSTNTDRLTLDLTPAMDKVIAELQTTQLGPIAGNINAKSGAGKLTLQSGAIVRLHRYYRLFQKGTVAVVALAVLSSALAVGLSVHHGKTVRRILFGVGILALLQALVLAAPSVVSLPGGDQVAQSAAKAFAQVLVHSLFIANLAVGVVCIGAAVGSKLYVKFRT